MATDLSEARAVDDDPNGLAMTIKQVIDDNLSDASTRRYAASLRGTLVVREPRADVAATVSFAQGAVSVANGAIPHPSATLEAGFEELAAISAGQLGPVWAVLSRKVRARGNLLLLLKMSRLLVYKE